MPNLGELYVDNNKNNKENKMTKMSKDRGIKGCITAL